MAVVDERARASLVVRRHDPVDLAVADEVLGQGQQADGPGDDRDRQQKPLDARRVAIDVDHDEEDRRDCQDQAQVVLRRMGVERQAHVPQRFIGAGQIAQQLCLEDSRLGRDRTDHRSGQRHQLENGEEDEGSHGDVCPRPDERLRRDESPLNEEDQNQRGRQADDDLLAPGADDAKRQRTEGQQRRQQQLDRPVESPGPGTADIDLRVHLCVTMGNQPVAGLHP